ncbi:MAG TPA: response regulator [Caulobacteraceae bacterium]|nr:response regulator [Caulobacteraceae bacterium]
MTVLVVDDDEAIRRSLVMLAEAGGHEAVAFADAETLLRGARLDEAGCVVTDVKMPGIGGLELLRILTGRAVGLPVIVITGHGDVATAVGALKAGAADFIEKPFDGRAFLAAIDKALARRSQTKARSREAEALRARRARLTEREAEVMDMIAAGLSNAETAARLGISVRTVENHRARVLDKMDARGLSELVRLAVRLEELREAQAVQET